MKKSMDFHREQSEIMMDAIRVVIKRLEQYEKNMEIRTSLSYERRMLRSTKAKAVYTVVKKIAKIIIVVS